MTTTLTLYDSCVPALKADEYTVTVSQSLRLASGKALDEAPKPVSLQFRVRGPRFALADSEVHRIFPPPRSTGRYHDILPMLVFERATLPWERDMKVADPEVPWVALLVLTGADLAPNPAADERGVVGMTLEAFRAPASGTCIPDIALEDGEDPPHIDVSALEITADAFARLMPSLADAKQLAHVRELAGDRSGDFGVVVSNRFGAPPPADPNVRQRTNRVHLVSLQGLESVLAAGLPAGTARVRLISLVSWTFTCVPDPKETFTQRMNALTSSGDLLLHPPALAGEAPALLQERLRRGYVALSHRLRSGKRALAWYRGPFAPEQVPRGLDTSGSHATASGAAMVFDPDSGMFDQSYAVAFEAGRMRALSAQPFATALQQWRRQAHAVVDRLLARLAELPGATDAQGQPVTDASGQLTAAGLADLTALLDARFMSRKLEDYFTGQLFGSIATAIGKAGGYDAKAPPVAPPASDADPADPIPALRSLMARPDVANLLAHLSGLSDTADQDHHGAILPGAILPWLTKLALLQGVSFDHLVPDLSMLPPESLRFFAVDPNWIDALIDGALSPGAQSSRDARFHQLTRDPLHRAVDRLLAGLRADALGGASAAGPMSGLLLRSGLVRDYSGLEVHATTLIGGAEAVMRPLRYERLSEELLLCLFPAIPARVHLDEPSQGLVFGLDDEGITARLLPSAPAAQLAATHTLTPAQIPFRGDPALGVLDLPRLFTQLSGLYADPKPTLSPATFALQMIRHPERKTILFTGLKAQAGTPS